MSADDVDDVVDALHLDDVFAFPGDTTTDAAAEQEVQQRAKKKAKSGGFESLNLRPEMCVETLFLLFDAVCV